MLIALAIISILTTIAVPNWYEMQMRAKRAELPTNVSGIKVAEIAYEAANDRFVEQTAYVPPLLSKQLRDWPSGSAFDSLGWAPDGKVRGQYRVKTISTTDFNVKGLSDIDEDFTPAEYSCTRTLGVKQLTSNKTF